MAERKYLIPRHFRLMLPIFALGLILPAAIAWALPPGLVTVLVAGACAISIASPRAAEFERAPGQSILRRIAIYAASPGLAMALFGTAMGWWIAVEPESARGVFGVVACVSVITAMLHLRNPHSMLLSMGACWGSFAAVDGRAASLLSLVSCLLIAGYFGWRQIAWEKEVAERELDEARRRTRAEDILRDYEETGQGWFWETDRRAILTYISESAASAIGTRASLLMGRPMTALFDLKDSSVEYERTLKFHLSARSAFLELPVRAAGRNAGGEGEGAEAEERWWSVSGRPIYDEFDNFMGFRGSGTDLTERKRTQDQASRLAMYDSLTGLANRLQMSQELEKLLAAPQQQNRACSIFLLDLDRFKQVNDTLGHPAGDYLLKQVARRLERTLGDQGRVGRLGGDEFEIILPGRQEKAKLSHLAQEVIHHLSQPYSIDGHQVMIGASVGISMAPDNGSTSEALIRNADLALYAAKDGGRGRYHFYSENLHDQARERLALENDLRQALVNGGLELYYQPFVKLESDRICGFEALMRWNHPKHGFVSPDKFISIAEESGLIEAIGEWAMRQACYQLSQWPEEIRIAVNVSPLQFANPKLASVVTNAIAQHQIDPSRLELEITESVFLNDDPSTDAMFAALKGIGVRLALDDFGTGYSSLGYLKSAPFDKIKIDKGFINGATEPGSRNGAIIVSIANLAASLGMDTTAEGVETLDELELVRSAGCSHVQGYIYERPLQADKASERLQKGLQATPSGPKSARLPRHKLFRRVLLDHSGQHYDGVVRNISRNGAMIEGLWNVPVGTIFEVYLSQDVVLLVTTRWSEGDRMGVEFAKPIEIAADGSIPAISGKPVTTKPQPEPLRKAG
ncbi:EAL domain-containing protein [Altererythrobacter sp. CAU 1778]